ncbi:MAG: hypothetical protein GWN11_07815, partial [Candidatus Dadabacteria bacterium]|nr:hypothetical protein [Candidatus Dadabacteria bacterium]
APLLIFFALTGAVQTLGFHHTLKKESIEKSGGKEVQAPLPVKVSKFLHRGHTQEMFVLSYKDNKDNTQKGRIIIEPFQKQSDDAKPLYLVFLLLMACGIIFTSSLGIIMAFKFSRTRLPVVCCLVSGILIPLLLYII